MCKPPLLFACVILTLPWGTGRLPGQTVAAAEQPTAEQLIAVLQSTEASQADKVAACRQLATVGTKDAVPALAALLPDEKLSHMARYALEPIPDPTVDEALRQALGQLRGRPLIGVIASLGVRRDAKAVPALSAMLQDADQGVAQAAAKALGKIGTTGAAQAARAGIGQGAQESRSAMADGCLGCAEALLAAGQPTQAAALYESVSKAQLPAYYRVAAARGAIRARKPAP